MWLQTAQLSIPGLRGFGFSVSLYAHLLSRWSLVVSGTTVTGPSRLLSRDTTTTGRFL